MTWCKTLSAESAFGAEIQSLMILFDLIAKLCRTLLEINPLKSFSLQNPTSVDFTFSLVGLTTDSLTVWLSSIVFSLATWAALLACKYTNETCSSLSKESHSLFFYWPANTQTKLAHHYQKSQ